MLRYTQINTPRIEAAGVQLLAPFEHIADLEGEFGYDMLFLTEWESRDSFESFQSDPEFLTLARGLRNRSLDRFAESEGQRIADF